MSPQTQKDGVADDYHAEFINLRHQYKMKHEFHLEGRRATGAVQKKGTMNLLTVNSDLALNFKTER